MKYSLKKLFSTLLDWVKHLISILQINNSLNIKMNCRLKIYLLSIRDLQPWQQNKIKLIEITSDSSLLEKFKSMP